LMVVSVLVIPTPLVILVAPMPPMTPTSYRPCYFSRALGTAWGSPSPRAASLFLRGRRTGPTATGSRRRVIEVCFQHPFVQLVGGLKCLAGRFDVHEGNGDSSGRLSRAIFTRQRLDALHWAVPVKILFDPLFGDILGQVSHPQMACLSHHSTSKPSVLAPRRPPSPPHVTLLHIAAPKALPALSHQQPCRH
jgi:hypothetical protein